MIKNKLYLNYKKNIHDLLAKDKYFSYLKIYKKVVFKAKLKYSNEQIKSKLNNARRLWKFINSKIKK